MKDKLIKKFVDGMMAFVNTKGVTAIKDGIVFSMPLLIVGSIFLILANLPVPALGFWPALALQFHSRWCNRPNDHLGPVQDS